MAKRTTPIEPATKARELPEGLTEADLTKLRMKHGNVAIYPITVTKDGKRHIGMFKKPTLTIMGAAASVGEADAIKGGMVIYTNCKVYVSPEDEADEEIKAAMMKGVSTLFRAYQAEVGEPYA